MKSNPRRGVRRAIAVGLAGLMLLAGCSGGGASTSSLPAAGGGNMDVNGAAPEYAPADGEAGSDPTTDPQIARRATVQLEVDDIAKAASALHDVADSLDGSVTNESLSLPTDDGVAAYSVSTVEVTVPSARLDDALTMIEKLGEVTDRQIESVDVTTQVVDVNARVTTMRDSIKRLQELMSKSGSVSEITTVESQLTQRQADLEALLASQKVLSQRVETAPITVQLSIKSTIEPQPVVSGFLPGLQAGWESLGATGRVALTILGALLPWLVLAAIIVVPIVAIRRHRKRVRMAHAAPAAATIPIPEPTKATATPATQEADQPPATASEESISEESVPEEEKSIPEEPHPSDEKN